MKEDVEKLIKEAKAKYGRIVYAIENIYLVN